MALGTVRVDSACRRQGFDRPKCHRYPAAGNLVSKPVQQARQSIVNKASIDLARRGVHVSAAGLSFWW